MIGMISLVSAFYPGETISMNNTLGTENIVYTIIDNTSALTVLPEVTINTTTVEVYFPMDMPPNDFTIVFMEEKTKEVIKEVYVGGGSSGGGTRTIYKDRNITEYVYRDRDVEKIVEVEDQEEIDRLLGIANDAVKGEWKFKTLFLLACAILLIMIILKIKNTKMEDKN